MSDSVAPAPEAPSSGTLRYNPRAFRQDSALAMGRDVVRALVEMVTNASDSYLRLERRGVAVDGIIEISAERVRTGDYHRIVVRDHAEGMNKADLTSRILELGARTSEAGDRGVQGRGAKDISFFGRATFESIRDGAYAQVEIDGGTNYEGLDERPATIEDRRRLGLGLTGNGTTVTLFVRRLQHSIPQHATLSRRLARNVQLRQIMTADTRTVTLTDLGRSASTGEPLRYVRPAPVRVVRSVRVEIDSYPDASGTLVIQSSDVPFEDERSMDRHGGILIEDGSAIHEATYFGLEGRPGALRFTGVLTCPYIRELQNRFDDADSATDDPGNPLPIITRTRQGLSREHPFTIALAKFVEAQLRPLVEAEEMVQAERAGQMTEDTKRRLRQVARDLGTKMVAVMKRLEVDYEPEGGTDGPSPEPVRLRVVPPTIYLQPEASQTISIHAWPEAWGDDQPDSWTAAITILDEGVLTGSAAEVLLEPDPKNPRRLRGAFSVTAGTTEDATLVEVRLGTTSEIVEVEVVAEDAAAPIAPTRLMFSQTSCRAHPGKPKTLVLMAPVESVEQARTANARLTTTHADISVPDSVALELRDAGDGRSWYEAELSVVVRSSVSGRVRAALGNQAAVCSVSPADESGRLPFNIKLLDELPRYASQGRADWSLPKGELTLRVFAKHPTLAPYFGDGMTRQDSKEARILLAEIIATEYASYQLTDPKRRTGRALAGDPYAYRTKLKEVAGELLPVAHAALVPEFWGPRS